MENLTPEEMNEQVLVYFETRANADKLCLKRLCILGTIMGSLNIMVPSASYIRCIVGCIWMVTIVSIYVIYRRNLYRYSVVQRAKEIRDEQLRSCEG